MYRQLLVANTYFFPRHLPTVTSSSVQCQVMSCVPTLPYSSPAVHSALLLSTLHTALHIYFYLHLHYNSHPWPQHNGLFVCLLFGKIPQKKKKPHFRAQSPSNMMNILMQFCLLCPTERNSPFWEQSYFDIHLTLHR